MNNDHGFEGTPLARPACRRIVRLLLLAVAGASMLPGLHTPVGAQTPLAPGAQQQKVRVSSVRVEGNTLLPEAVLSGLTAGLAGSERSLPELNQVAARVQNAYRDAGYGGVVAYVPEQDISGGVIVIRVVEGKLANVRVTGNAHFDTANIRAGLPNLREGATPVVRAIDRDIQMSNENPAKTVKVTLAAGAQPAAIDADVDVTDGKPLQFLLGYSNTGQPVNGRHRVTVGLQHANLFGGDQVATVQYQTSPEHPDLVRIFSVGYRAPFYAHAASIDAFFAHSNVGIGTTSTPAGAFTFTGKGTIVGLRGNRNLGRVGEYEHRLTAGVDWRDYENDCALGDFGAAACGPAGVSVTAVPVIVSYTGQGRGPTTAWGFNASLSANAGGSSQATFEAARPGAKRHYAVARAAGFGEVALPAGFALNGRLDVQYSPHALITGEKFGVGGAGTVRGYEERELSGDYGLVARLEALAAQLQPGPNVRVRPYLFVDHGRVANHKDLPCRAAGRTSCSVTGAGVGARLNVGKNASAVLDIGRAFSNAITTSSGDVRGHVSINVAF